MKGHVLKGKLLTKLVEVKEKTTGGIIIPQTATKHKVVDVVIGGEEVKEGDRVYIHTGLKLNIDGEDYILVNEKEVLYIE